MVFRSSLEEQCYRILEEKGGKIADRAKMILLDEISSEGLQHPLQYVSQVWRDPLVPSFIILSCEAVGGRPAKAAHEASMAISLLNLSCKLWDDIIDRTRYIGFVPTVLGKFGDEVALITGGLVSARAFSMLAEIEVDKPRYRIITSLVWDYCKTIGEEEAENLKLRKRNDVRPEEKLRLLEMGGVNLEIPTKIGGILGNGSEDEIRLLGSYGRCLGTILALEEDLKASLNMTLDLSEKVKRNALPYALLWAKARSAKIEESLQRLTEERKPSDVEGLVEAVLETGALENTLSIVKDLTMKAAKAITSLRESESHSLLLFFVEAQRQILAESFHGLLN